MSEPTPNASPPAGASSPGLLAVWGALAGFLAGVVFMAINAWSATSTGHPAFTPFRTVATLAQGPPPAAATVWIGMVIHSLLAALFGLVLAIVFAPLRRRGVRTGALIWAGLVYGGLIYVVDFQVLARLVGQFTAFRSTNQPLELAAHLVFGAVLAGLLALAPDRPRTHATAEGGATRPT